MNTYLTERYHNGELIKGHVEASDWEAAQAKAQADHPATMVIGERWKVTG